MGYIEWAYKLDSMCILCFQSTNYFLVLFCVMLEICCFIKQNAFNRRVSVMFRKVQSSTRDSTAFWLDSWWAWLYTVVLGILSVIISLYENSFYFYFFYILLWYLLFYFLFVCNSIYLHIILDFFIWNVYVLISTFTYICFVSQLDKNDCIYCIFVSHWQFLVLKGIYINYKNVPKTSPFHMFTFF